MTSKPRFLLESRALARGGVVQSLAAMAGNFAVSAVAREYATAVARVPKKMWKSYG